MFHRVQIPILKCERQDAFSSNGGSDGRERGRRPPSRIPGLVLGCRFRRGLVRLARLAAGLQDPQGPRHPRKRRSPLTRRRRGGPRLVPKRRAHSCRKSARHSGDEPCLRRLPAQASRKKRRSGLSERGANLGLASSRQPRPADHQEGPRARGAPGDEDRRGLARDGEARHRRGRDARLIEGAKPRMFEKRRLDRRPERKSSGPWKKGQCEPCGRRHQDEP